MSDEYVSTIGHTVSLQVQSELNCVLLYARTFMQVGHRLPSFNISGEITYSSNYITMLILNETVQPVGRI